jgi:hypothetical protein
MSALALRAWEGGFRLLKGRGGLVAGVLPEAVNSREEMAREVPGHPADQPQFF